MNIFRQLMEKPWEQQTSAHLAAAGGPSFVLPAQAVALRAFLCVASVLFTLLVAAYSERMLYEDWRPTPRQWLLWSNTALLIVSSVAFQWAYYSIRRGRLDDTRAGLAAAGLFAAGFLAGQVWAWRQLDTMPVFDITNPAVAFFYVITGLHALHLLGGMVVWGRTTVALWRRPDPARAVLPVRLCAVYWHYLLVLWLILFGLLFSGNDNLTFLLAICGLR